MSKNIEYQETHIQHQGFYLLVMPIFLIKEILHNFCMHRYKYHFIEKHTGKCKHFPCVSHMEFYYTLT